MSKNFPDNPLKLVSEQKLCSEKIDAVSFYWTDENSDFPYGIIAHAKIELTAIQPLNNLGLALYIFDETGLCIFANQHARLEPASSAPALAAGPHQISFGFQTSLPPGRYALTFSLAEHSSRADNDPAAWEVLCQQAYYLPFNILEEGTHPRPPGYAQIQTYIAWKGPTELDSIPALGNVPWAPVQYTLQDVLSTLEVTLPNRIAGKAIEEFPATLGMQQLPLFLPVHHARFHTVIGQRSQRGVTTTGQAGVLLYGPYIPASPGVYIAIFDINSRSINDADMVRLDIVADKGKLCLGKTEWSPREQQAAKIFFEISESGISDLEFRVIVTSQGDYDIRSITVLSPQLEKLQQALAKTLSSSLPQRKSQFALLHLPPDNTEGLPLLRLAYRGGLTSPEAAYRQLAPMLTTNTIVAVEDASGAKAPVFYHGGQQRPVYLILLMPENHFAWTEVLLALAIQLWKQEGGVSIFVTPDSVKLPNLAGSPAVHSTITLDNLIATLEGLEFSRLYVHAFGHPEITERLQHSFPKTPAAFYSDGFKNTLPDLPQAEEIVFFGWSPTPSLCPQRIVTNEVFHTAIEQLSKNFELPKTALAADVMLCLRYYGSAPYELATDQVCQLIWETTRTVLRPGDTLIVKADARAPDLTQTVIAFLAERHTGEVRDFANEVGEWAAKPLELLFATDCLTKIRDFVVFDSSLCWLLLHIPKLRHDLRVVFGANLASINGSVSSENKTDQMITTIRHCTYSYANALERDGCLVNRLADACYVVSRPERGPNIYPSPTIPEWPSFSPQARNEEAWLHRHQAICAYSEKPAPQFLWFGDSLTQRLENHGDLVEQHLPFTMLNAGFSGDRTEHLLWRLKEREGQGLSPTAVVVWIGTNDIGQIQTTPPAEQVFCNIRAICREVEDRFPQSKKVLIGLLPRDVSAVHLFRRIIKEVNSLLEIYAQKKGWLFIDEGARFVDDSGHLRMDLMPDGLHLNKEGYEVLLQAVQAPLQELMNKKQKSKMRTIAVIPAKGYSSRVPEKNFRPFHQGRSLLEIKIEQCKQSGAFDAIYVSSDDNRAAEIAQQHGVTFVSRDAKLCQDSTPWYEVLEGVLDSLPEDDDVWVAWCPVTSPLFRRYDELMKSLDEKLSDGTNSIATVTPLKHYYLNDNFIPLNHRWGVWHAYSQAIPPIHQLNLACIISQKQEMKFCQYQIGSRPTFFPTEVWEGLDIDTLEEFELAQWYYDRYFGHQDV